MVAVARTTQEKIDFPLANIADIADIESMDKRLTLGQAGSLLREKGFSFSRRSLQSWALAGHLGSIFRVPPRGRIYLTVSGVQMFIREMEHSNGSRRS